MASIVRAGRRGWAADPLRATAWMLLLVAAGFAGWSGSSWNLAAAHADPAAYSRTRDAALQAGEQAVQNFNALDYRNVGPGIRLWEESSTGALHSEIVAGRAQFEQQIRRAKTVTTARILDGALTALNTRAGTASIIVAIQLTVTPTHGAPVVKQSRLAGQLTRTAAGWRLSALSQVPVGAAAGRGKTAGGG